MDESTISHRNPDYTPNARQWLLNIGKSFGMDLSAFPNDESRELFLEMIFEPFDYYTKHGLDFGSAYLRAIGDIAQEIKAQKDDK